jgi:hypothetical protein
MMVASFCKQLGIKEEQLVVCLHCKEQFFAKMRNQLPAYARAAQVMSEHINPNVIIRFFNEFADFDSSFRWLGSRLAPNGIIWGVVVRKSALRPGQRYLGEEMKRAAKRAGFLPSKKLSFSATEEGHKFTLKKAKKKK